MPRSLSGDVRATSPVVGIALLVGLTAVLAASVGTATLAFADDIPDASPPVVVSLSVTDDRVALVHERGPSLDVRELSVVVAVDGDPLRVQPPVPFFAATGFESGPTGPFNAASDPQWSAGERASFGIAGTNTALEPGAEVTVTLIRDEQVLARASAVAQSSPTAATVVIARGLPG